MLTFPQISNIVGAITYRPGWNIILGRDKDTYVEKFTGWKTVPGRPYIQITVTTESEASLSPFTGEREAWKSGKHYLSWHMCRQEIVGAVFGAIKSAEEHEMKEWFTYRGARIYNPHLDPDALVLVARKKENFNFRENAMSMEEASN